VLERLAKVGVPNRIGEQRFGYMMRNHLVGRALILDDWRGVLDALLAPADRPGINDGQAEGRAMYLRGEYAAAKDVFVKESRTERRVLAALAAGRNERQAALAMEPPERSFFLTAFQSAAFNRVLDERIAGGALGRLFEGDLAFKHDSRAVFKVGRAELDDPSTVERLARFEISPSGPMWGATMTRAEGKVDEAEVAALMSLGVGPDTLAAAEARRVPLPGERRSLRVPLIDPDVEGGADEHGAYVRCAFDLPRGAFATSVMQEVMKVAVAEGPMGDGDEE
jgi:tRNA pseudouridine13 synthase